MKDVILTGVRSNDEPTLGNYLGAFVPMVRLQREKAGEYQLNMFVPDLHSFTTPIDHTSLYERTMKNLKYFVAAGLDIENTDTFIYRQSYISAHSELTWILDCFTSMGEMSRMTQFKDKSKSAEADAAVFAHESAQEARFMQYKNASEDEKKQLDETAMLELVDSLMKLLRMNDEREKSVGSVRVGLFNYPVLMAADILLYGAKWVPVGDDQKQHLEITRDLAIRMNTKFGELFTLPENWQNQLEFASLNSGVRIRSLSNPEKKMSKSISDPRGTILLSDNPTDAAKKVMSATTDSIGEIHFDWVEQPGITNLLQMLALLSGRDQSEVNADWVGQTKYGDLKKAVAMQVETFLSDFHAKYDAVDDAALIAKLEASESQMRAVADKTLLNVQRAVGLRPKD